MVKETVVYSEVEAKLRICYSHLNTGLTTLRWIALVAHVM